MMSMISGGCVITLTKPSFDAEEMLVAIHKHRPMSIAIVGDSFAKPILNELNANPGKYDTTSVAMITSSGVMWSYEVKQGLLEHIPQAVLSDAFSSSEALGMGSSMMTKAGAMPTARFTIGDRAKVIDENDNFIEPGSDTPGLVALGPPNPIGYYKDEEKTARTFRTINGVRYSIPGDFCLVGADGTITLLGRGNACINTAGEKVFPEEVEEALKTHDSVEDALVIGLPDEKWGQAITGVVRLKAGAKLDEEALRQHVRSKLASYKTPKRVFVADANLRASNGKADYKAARESVDRSLAAG
jgi:fatty-acyl-CoA synthase